MLALCLMLLATYYALNYAGIIGRGLVEACRLSVTVCEVCSRQVCTIWRYYVQNILFLQCHLSWDEKLATQPVAMSVPRLFMTELCIITIVH